MGTSAANWLVGKVLNLLSDELVAAYVASKELGLNSEKIKHDLEFTSGLLQAAQMMSVGESSGLGKLVQALTAKAREAEDALDELHYFIIQDQLDGTRYAAPDLGDDLGGYARHSLHALRHTIGNCIACFSCSRTQDGDANVTNNPPNAIPNPGSGDNDAPLDRLPFDRVAMSSKIKSVIEEMHSLCAPIAELLKIAPHHVDTETSNQRRPLIGSMTMQDTLYGRREIFEKTIEDITGGRYCCETLSVIPIVGPGGIGKTTLAQHLYNDERTKEHFTVRVWVSVSTHFDVLDITQQIHNSMAQIETGGNNIFNGSTNLNQLQESVAHRLKSKRFLIVLDDMWKCDDNWDILIAPFKNEGAKGSMILITTRLPKIEERVKTYSIPINLQGLEPTEFFQFFQTCVFDENKPHQQYNELLQTGKDIAKRLKCSPLAAKTVARLLRKDLSLEHWRRVLNNNEWENETETKGDIMSALKVSYYYLPFHLKQRFSYLSLFPEGYRFDILETASFWTAIGILGSSRENHEYLEELVGNGFLVEKVIHPRYKYYVMHDLFHELSRKVSTQECLNICSLSFSARAIPQSVKHMSITIENRYDENFKEEMAMLKRWINIGTLRTLMIFREYDERMAYIFNNTFEEIEGLRVLFIVINSLEALPRNSHEALPRNSLEALPRNFSKLLHLRYLKISLKIGVSNMSLPSTIPIFYHLISLDLKDWYGSYNLPRHISRLVNLHHFIAANELHSNVPGVGKIKHLEELKEFHVRKESVGFELEELGKLRDLGGQLSIYNLEKVMSKEEATKAKLDLKKNLKRLALVWGTDLQLAADGNVIDGLQPHDNLIELSIKGHGTTAIGPPRWLCDGLTSKHLESLTLEDVSCNTLPPFGQLPYLKTVVLKNIAKLRCIGPDHGFTQLEKVMIDNLPNLEEWVVGSNCQSFEALQSIECSDCPNLLTLPFLLECSTSEDRKKCYPSLCTFDIQQCPLLYLTPMPHVSTLTYFRVEDTSYGSMSYMNNILYLKCYDGAVALHNLDKVLCILVEGESKTQWADLPKLTSLEGLIIKQESSKLSMDFLSNLTSLHSLALIDCENLTMEGFTPLIIVNLQRLKVYNCGRVRSIAADLLSEVARIPDAAGAFHQLTELGVDNISAVLVAPICTLLAATLEKLIFYYDERIESFTEEEGSAIQLLTSLQELSFVNCRGLTSLPEGLHALSSLRYLEVNCSPEIRSLPKGGLPTSLQHILLWSCSVELEEQAEELRGTNPGLWVNETEDYYLG